MLMRLGSRRLHSEDMAQGAQSRLEDAERRLSAISSNQSSTRAVVAHLAGRIAAHGGQLDRAFELYSSAIEEIPTLRPAIRDIRHILWRQGDKKNILEWLDLQIRSTTHPREAAALYRERGRWVRSVFEDLDATRQCYEAARLASPDDFSVLHALAQTNLEIGDLDAARKTLQRIRELLDDPVYSALLDHRLSSLHRFIDEEDQSAFERLQNAQRGLPDNPILAHDLWLHALQSEAPEQIAVALQAQLQLRRDLPPSSAFLGNAASVVAEHCDPRVALKLLRASAEHSAQRLDGWAHLFRVAQAQEDSATSIVALLARIKILNEGAPHERAQAWCNLGELLSKSDRNDARSLACFRKAVELDPQHRLASQCLLEGLREQQHWKAFVEFVAFWADRSDTDADANERAVWLEDAAFVCARYLDAPDAATKLLNAALRHDPRYIPARAALTQLYFENHLDENAYEIISQELKDDKTSATRKNYLRTVVCHVLMQRLELPSLVHECAQLVEESPHDLAALLSLARRYSALGQSEAEQDIFLQVAEFSSNDRMKSHWLALAGMLALERGQYEVATVYFHDAHAQDESDYAILRYLEVVSHRLDDTTALTDSLRQQIGREACTQATRLELARWLRNEDPEQSAELIDQVLEENPWSWTALRQAAQNRAARSDLRSQAELQLRLALRCNPSHAASRLLLRSAHAQWRSQQEQEIILDTLNQCSAHELSSGFKSWVRTQVIAKHCPAMLWPLVRKHLIEEPEHPVTRLMVARWRLQEQDPQKTGWALARMSDAQPKDALLAHELWGYAHQTGQPALVKRALSRWADCLSAAPSLQRWAMWWVEYLNLRADLHLGEWSNAYQHYRTLSTGVIQHLADTPLVERICEHHDQQPLRNAVSRLKLVRTEQRSKALRLHTNLWIADILAKGGEHQEALRRCEQILTTTPTFMPAHYLRLDILQRCTHDADAEQRSLRAEAYLEFAAHHPIAKIRARAMHLAAQDQIQASLLLSPQVSPEAWSTLCEAFVQDPLNDAIFEDCFRYSTQYSDLPRPSSMVQALAQRLEELSTCAASDPAIVQSLHGALAMCPPLGALTLLESWNEKRPTSVAITLLRARCLAELQRWPELVQTLQQAAQHETIPRKREIITRWTAEALERCDDLQGAFDIWIELRASSRDQNTAHTAAERAVELAQAMGDTEQVCRVLEHLIRQSPADLQARWIESRVLAGPLGTISAETTQDWLSSVLATPSPSLPVIAQLHEHLCQENGQKQAHAPLRWAITRQQHRLQWACQTAQTCPFDLVNLSHSLGRFFSMVGDPDGAYLATAVIEHLAPQRLKGPSCDILRSEPWPLPERPRFSIYPYIFFNLSSIRLLRRLVHLRNFSAELPQMRVTAAVDGKPLSPDRDAYRIVQNLAGLMGLRQVHVLVDLQQQELVHAHWDQGQPQIVLSRKVYNAPMAPRSRDLIGRALFRLSIGGDPLWRCLEPRKRITLALLGDAITHPEQIETLSEKILDPEFLSSLMSEYQKDESRCAFETNASWDTQDLLRQAADLDQSLMNAEDRAGLLCSADPRAALAICARRDNPEGTAVMHLTSYILSEIHLEIRRHLGYQHHAELQEHDLEEVSA